MWTLKVFALIFLRCNVFATNLRNSGMDELINGAKISFNGDCPGGQCRFEMSFNPPVTAVSKKGNFVF